MKLVTEMTPVELLSEFCRKREYHEAVAEARQDKEHLDHTYGDPHSGTLHLKYPGRPLGEVREPRPAEDQRWADLCAEINRRFTPPLTEGW
jgi:hypothetical protein